MNQFLENYLFPLGILTNAFVKICNTKTTTVIFHFCTCIQTLIPLRPESKHQPLHGLTALEKRSAYKWGDSS